eukprot:10968093-Ditylum_brightwellii.AAC.1
MSMRLEDWRSKVQVHSDSRAGYLIVSISIGASKLNKKYEIMGDYGYGKVFPNHMELIKKKCDLVNKMHMENEANSDHLAEE